MTRLYSINADKRVWLIPNWVILYSPESKPVSQARGAERSSGQMRAVNVHFVLYDASTGAAVSKISLLVFENATYEDIIQMLIQRQVLRSLNSQLRYNLVLEIVGLKIRTIRWGQDGFRLPDPPTRAILREGQTLASTELLEYFPEPKIEGQEVNGLSIYQLKLVPNLHCAIYVEKNASPLPRKEPSSVSPSLGEIINAFLTSPAVNIINLTASVVTITTALILIEKWWLKKHSTESASSQGRSSQPSETDIVAIHLRMTHGPDHEFEEWLTDTDRLKHYIDVFNEPSSSIQPLQAVFVQRNGKAIKVDVSEGTQNNLQLVELLNYLNIDETDKGRAKRKAVSWSTHFIFYRTMDHESVPTNHEYWGTIYDLTITYEELIEFLIEKKHLLLPLDPPLRYTLTFKGIGDDGPCFGPCVLKEGQTVLDALHTAYPVEGSQYAFSHYECDISIETETSPKEK